MRAIVVEPEGLNAYWSLKTRDGGGVSSTLRVINELRYNDRDAA